jgi:membrane-associated phospholipid phosphatase
MPTRVHSVVRDFLEVPVTTRTVRPGLRRLRLVLAACWLVGLAAWTHWQGPPLDLKSVLAWLSLAMLVASAGNPVGWAKSMVLDWFPLYLVLVGYNVAWGLVDNLGLRPHVEPQLGFDQALFGDRTLIAPLQDRLWAGGPPHLYDYAFWVLYLSHFVATLGVAAGLWMRARGTFLAFRRRVLTAWFGALAVFAAYPTVPPWMAAEQGHLEPMTRVIGAVNRAVYPGATQRVLTESDGRIDLANPVAAVPSMHSALPMLLVLFLWPMARRWWRPLLAAYPVLMGFVLVYGGEHYVFDVLVGWLWALGVHAGITWFERRRRRTAGPPEPPDATVPGLTASRAAVPAGTLGRPSASAARPSAVLPAPSRQRSPGP